MNALTSEFLQACQEQDIALAPLLVAELRDPFPTRQHNMYAPAGIHSAIAAGGGLLRKHPDEQLAAQPLRGSWTDIGAATLQRMINGLHEPATAAVDFGAQPPGPGISACQSAELHFADALHRFHSSYSSPPDECGSEIFVDPADDDRPVLVRKGAGLSSVLSLEEISIGGVPYPPGALLRADTNDELATDELPFASEAVIKTRPVSDIGHIAFIRLSSFAVPPQERLTTFASVKPTSLWPSVREWYSTVQPEALQPLVQDFLRPQSRRARRTA